jgi:hypothetical protein
MHHGRWTPALILLGLLLAPFAPVHGEPPPDALSRETRFARSLCIEAEGISIGELLMRLSDATGLPLRAGREVADEKVIVFGPPRPLREVLRDLAALVGAEWQERTAEDAAPYFLLEKRSAARRRETMLAESVTEQMLQQMEERVRALRESPQEFARRAPDDDIRYFLSRPDGKAREAVAFYASLDRRQRRELFERGHLRLFYRSLSPAWQAVSLRELASWREAYEKSKNTISFRAAVGKPRETPPDLELKRHWRGDGVATVHFYPGFIPLAELRAKRPRLPRHGDPFTDAPVPAQAVLPPIPTLDAASKEPGAEWPDRLRRLSDAGNVPIVADYYRLRCAPDPMPAPATPPTDATAALDVFSAREGSLWWTRGRTLLFRKTDWYERRLYEPPDAWLVGVSREIAARDNWASYTDILRLKELTPRQILGVAALNDERRGWLPYALSYPAEKLAGIAEFLNLLRVRPLPNGRPTTPLLSREDTSSAAYNQALEQFTLRYAHLTPYQRQLIPPFLAAQSKSLEGEPIEGFFCSVTAYAPQNGERGYRYQRVVLHWQVGPGGTQEDFEISLPLTLPDDRRAKTRIMLAPS